MMNDTLQQVANGVSTNEMILWLAFLAVFAFVAWLVLRERRGND